jgi:hypothetical protein
VPPNTEWAIKSTDGPRRLALYQTSAVGLLYTSFSGLMKKFLKNKHKPVKTIDSSTAHIASRMHVALAHGTLSEERVC